MASRILQKRLEAEAAEKLGKTAKKKKATRKKATRKKAKSTRKRKTKKTTERKKIFWGVFSGTLKEEGRFAYDERDKAEEKLAALRNRSTKKLYFIQPIKETLSDAAASDDDSAAEEDDELLDDIKAKKSLDDEDDDEDEDDDSEEE